MRFGRAIVALAAVSAALVASKLPAEIIVNAPQAITRQVSVQLIRTALDNGTSPATVFGDATQRAAIEAAIDTIWAQAGIDIKILPTITPYSNTFAYQGNNGSGPRNSGDLNTIFTNAGAAGVLNPDALTLNLIMVNVVPQFAPLDENTSAGYARQPGNGILGYVGDNLLTFVNGRDVIASVMAHEIGHNLGLPHTADNIANLMSPNGTSEQLTQAQIDTARLSNLARLFSPIAGDYNNNGVVDAADYVVWRNTGIGSYATWRSRFGMTSGSASGLGDSALASGAVPEPAALVYLLVVSTALFFSRGARSR